MSAEEFFALYRGIAESSGDPGFGLKLGTEERVERYDPIKLAALSARSFRDAVERLSRYKQLTCSEEIRVLKRGNESAVQFVWLLAHRGTGRPLSPKRVVLERAAAHRRLYEAHFRCPVKFKSKQSALIFSNTDMDLPFVTYNPDLLAIVAPQLESELAQQLAQKTSPNKQKAF